MSAAAFEYRALDHGGRERRGVAEAGSREAAYRQVVAMGLTPVTLTPVARARKARSRRVSIKDIAQFTYQLAILIEARIPLSDGLSTIAEQETNARFRGVLTDLAGRVQSGQPVSAAMNEHRALFGEVYIETIRAAEQTGNMGTILEHLSGMMERADETRRQVKGALMYPAIVVGTLGIAVSFLLAFVVPKFAGMFETRGVELPMLTRALMAFGHSLHDFWWAWALGIGVAAFGVHRMWKAPGARLRLDRVLHRVPYIRDVLKGLAISRFARVFGLGLSSGIGLMDALLLSGRASGRPMLEADTRRMSDQVRAGGRLAEVMETCAYFNVFVKRMISAGEHSGELPKMCETIARQHERETTQLTKNLATIIEPVLVVLIAGVVLVVALAIFLPMWDMVKLME